MNPSRRRQCQLCGGARCGESHRLRVNVFEPSGMKVGSIKIWSSSPRKNSKVSGMINPSMISARCLLCRPMRHDVYSPNGVIVVAPAHSTHISPSCVGIPVQPGTVGETYRKGDHSNVCRPDEHQQHLQASSLRSTTTLSIRGESSSHTFVQLSPGLLASEEHLECLLL